MGGCPAQSGNRGALVGGIVVASSWRMYAARAAIALTVLISVLVLQTAVFSFIPLYGVHPDLMLVTIISLGFLRGPLQGAGLGAVGGLLADILTGQLIGLGAIVLAMVGCIAGLIGLRLVREKTLLPVFLCALGSALHLCLYALGVWAFGLRFPIVEGVMTIVPPLTVYNMLAMVAFHPLLVLLNRVVDRHLVVSRRPATGS